jgi:cytochrome b
MDSLFFHPKLVHLPLGLAMVMPLIAAFLALGWWRGWFSLRLWGLAVGLQLLLVGSTYLAMEAGEDEEDRVEDVISHDLIHEHEEKAEDFMTSTIVVLVLMGAALAVSKKKAGLPLAAISVAGTLVSVGLAYRAGEAGGDLVYRHGAASAYTDGAPASGADHDGDEH